MLAEKYHVGPITPITLPSCRTAAASAGLRRLSSSTHAIDQVASDQRGCRHILIGNGTGNAGDGPVVA